MLEIKTLTLEKAKCIYQCYMPEDFPPAELRPFSSIRNLYSRGLYSCFALLESDRLTGYAFYSRTKDGRYFLLDYFAILKENRERGLGSAFLSMLREYLPNTCAAVLIEAEDPACAKNEEDLAARQRRVHFYTRNGCVETGFGFTIYGVDYTILAQPVNASLPDRDEMYAAILEIYHSMFPPLLFHAVCRPRKP